MEDEPSYTTICVHGEISSSLRSMIFYPRQKRMKLLHGHPCQTSTKSSISVHSADGSQSEFTLFNCHAL